ncbi:MAG: AlwI family type II restriction endonuclease [Bacilli bacterium]|nr:AlwI family type II restriction endonuclease [Bacilli bacterium]
MLQIMKSEKKAIKKPLSFSTTMRNPNRIANFLTCLLPFENQILSDQLIMKIVEKVIYNKLYWTRYEKRNDIYRNIYDSEDLFFTSKQVKDIIINSPQNHKEFGFNKGWPSRFDTWFKLPMEFGFVYYKMNEPLKISNTGHMLIDAFNEDEQINQLKIQNVFLNSLMKYQTNNPFRKNANNNIPLILLLQVIKLLKQEDDASAGIFRQELSLFICWNNNDASELCKLIKQIRATQGFNYSDEYIYDICLGILGADETQKKRFKINQICGEAVDEFIRKMQITGIFSLRGNGRFLDINSFEKEKIDYILEKYTGPINFKSKEQYFNYMGVIDSKILSYDEENETIQVDLRQKKLQELANVYSFADITKELKLLCSTKKEESKDEMFRYIGAPTRLEFLISIALTQSFKNLEILPNYSVDDEGLPRFTAGGGIADIVCKSKETSDTLIEVTLMCGRHDQVNNEIIPIKRHLTEYKQKVKEDTFSIFLAPKIHVDVIEAIKLYKHFNNIDIIAFDILEFLTIIKEISNLNELVNNNDSNL